MSRSPSPPFPIPYPPALVVSRAAGDGFLLEGGLSAAGSMLRWLSDLTSLSPAELMARAAAAPAGAAGVIALPWFGGARAPRWRPRARAGLLGLGFEHDAGHLARAAVESVAVEVRRCLEATAAPAARPRPHRRRWQHRPVGWRS